MTAATPEEAAQIMPTMALTVAQRAAQALVISKTEEELKTLATNSVSIVKITNPDGYDQCHAARMVLKNTRLEIAKRGKEARDEATQFSKAVIAEQDRLILIISPEEIRLQAIQDAWEAEVKAEKERKIEAERQRVADLQDRVLELRGNPSLSAQTSSALLLEHISDLDDITVDDSFQEFREQATEAKAAGLARLHEIHVAALARETEEARIKAEREELSQLREESVKREAADRARIAEEDRVAKEKRAAEEKSAAVAAAARKADLDRLEAEARTRHEAEESRLAAERAELDRQAEDQRLAAEAEQTRLDAEREDLARREEALKPKPVLQAVPDTTAETTPLAAPIEDLSRPADEEIIAAIAAHFDVSTNTVIDWLRHMDLRVREAA